MTAPPTHIGDRELPDRARPVPFCRQGFLPPPLTHPLGFVAPLPARRTAGWLSTSACSSGSRTGPATSALGTASSPAGERSSDTTGNFTVSVAIGYPPAPGLWCTTTTPPRAPGTAPRTRRRFSAGRTATTSRFRVVTRSAP